MKMDCRKLTQVLEYIQTDLDHKIKLADLAALSA